MQAFKTHTGIVMPFNRANIDTDMIIPKQFMRSISRTGFGQHLFDSLRYMDEGQPGQDCSRRCLNPDFQLNFPRYKQASILVAQENFGCGSSREHAPWALLEYGFRVIIAPSFADIFHTNAFKNGLLLITLSKDRVEYLIEATNRHQNFRLTVDLEKCKLDSNKGYQFDFEISEFHRHKLLKGLDEIGSTLMHAEKIKNFEKTHQHAVPWVFNGIQGDITA